MTPRIGNVTLCWAGSILLKRNSFHYPPDIYILILNKIYHIYMIYIYNIDILYIIDNIYNFMLG